jgi:transcriptional regulator with XRE-family HTH domain
MGIIITDAFPNPMAEIPDKPPLPAEAKKKLVGLRLRAVREALKLRPVDVCKTLGFAQNLYSQWESGKSRPNLDDMLLLCDHYGVGLDWVYLGDKSAVHRDRRVADEAIRIYEALKAHPTAA